MIFNGPLKLAVVVIIASLIIGGGYVIYSQFSKTSISSFDECVAAGYPVMESYPEQCRANGQTFIRQIQ